MNEATLWGGRRLRQVRERARRPRADRHGKRQRRTLSDKQLSNARRYGGCAASGRQTMFGRPSTMTARTAPLSQIGGEQATVHVVLDARSGALAL